MPTNLSILVYVGDPVDLPEYRHAALFLEFSNGSTCVLHIKGAPGILEFHMKENYNPEQSQYLGKKIPVAEIPESIDELSIRGVISRTPVKLDRDWNCQNWVEDALIRMADNGYIDISQQQSAFYSMFDTCLEAALF